MGYLIGCLIGMCIFGLVTWGINYSRGRDGGFWWGFFLGVIGIIIVAVHPNE